MLRETALREKLLGIKCGHAAETRRGHRLAIPMIGHVARGEDTGDGGVCDLVGLR